MLKIKVLQLFNNILNELLVKRNLFNEDVIRRPYYKIRVWHITYKYLGLNLEEI